MSRFAAHHRVFFIEEPEFGVPFDFYNIKWDRETKVWVVVPHLASNISTTESKKRQRLIVDDLIRIAGVTDYVAWYYTPMALPFSDHLRPVATVYDCMDELSSFKFAPPELLSLEKHLFGLSDIVFVGGRSLYEAKKKHHDNIHAFPSSIDKNHFMSARAFQEEPPDQAAIPHPKLGFFGVIDERFNVDLVREMAAQRPDVHFVLIGPVVKIDPEYLPQADNIHYLGNKDYRELPRYLSGWDMAIMPFAHNESTRFISPTKTPEYLAGGQPVISTAIRDVVYPYGEKGLVWIADTVEEFIEAIDEIMNMNYGAYLTWLAAADEFIDAMSWDHTFQEMETHILETIDMNSQHENSRNHV